MMQQQHLLEIKLLNKIKVTDGKGTDKEITVHDTMDAQLTLDAASIKVEQNGTLLIAVSIQFQPQV